MNLEGRIIGVDFDGCVASGAKVKIRLARELLGLQITAEQTSEEAFSRLYGNAQYRILTDASAELTREFEPLPYCREVLLSLQQEGATPVVFTSREDHKVTAAREFNLAYGIPIRTFHNTNRQSKRAIISELSPVAYIDDTLGKLVELQGLGVALCFLRQEWNKEDHTEAEKLAVTGALAIADWWPEFYSRVTGKEFPLEVAALGRP